jgi:hypothetical protein
MGAAMYPKRVRIALYRFPVAHVIGSAWHLPQAGCHACKLSDHPFQNQLKDQECLGKS